MTDPQSNTVFTGDGLRAVLTTEGGVGLLELTVDSRCPIVGEEAELEVLLQPRTANGLPEGPAQRLFSTRIQLRLAPEGRARRGRCWLPAYLKPKLLLLCYFRIGPGKLGEQDR